MPRWTRSARQPDLARSARYSASRLAGRPGASSGLSFVNSLEMDLLPGVFGDLDPGRLVPSLSELTAVLLSLVATAGWRCVVSYRGCPTTAVRAWRTATPCRGTSYRRCCVRSVAVLRRCG